MFRIKQAGLNLKKRYEARRQKNLCLWHQASNDCEQIVELIIRRYSPKRIIQWGSLLNADLFDEKSDIDLAVEGIPDAERFFSLLGDVMNMTDFKVDIVQLEKIEKEFAEIITDKGVVIYENRD